MLGSRRLELGAIEGDPAKTHKPRPGAQGQHLDEQLVERAEVPAAEAGMER